MGGRTVIVEQCRVGGVGSDGADRAAPRGRQCGAGHATGTRREAARIAAGMRALVRDGICKGKLVVKVVVNRVDALIGHGRAANKRYT